MKRIIALLFVLLLAAEVHANSLSSFGGAPRPLVLNSLEGKSVRLEQFGGRVVIVNFWATWCPPCRAEMPSLWRLQQAIGVSRVAVLAVNIGESEDVVRAFLPDAMARDFTVLLDRNGGVRSAWRVSAYPTTFVIGADGRFRYRVTGPVEWDAAAIQRQILALVPPGP